MITVTISCDGVVCSRSRTTDIHPTRTLKVQARHAGWTVGNKKHYCPTCAPLKKSVKRPFNRDQPRLFHEVDPYD